MRECYSRFFLIESVMNETKYNIFQQISSDRHGISCRRRELRQFFIRRNKFKCHSINHKFDVKP